MRLILDKATSRKILNIILIAILFYWALKNYGVLFGLVGKIAGPLTPLFIGAALAFVLNIPMTFFEGLLDKTKIRKFKRGISILLTITLLILILVLVLFIVLPEIGRTFENLVAILPDFIDNTLAWFNRLTEKYPELNQWIADTGFSLDNVGEGALEFLKTSGMTVADYSLKIVTIIVSGTVSFFLGSVFATYILLEKENLSRQLTRLLFAFVPVNVGKRILEILSLTNHTFTKFVTGQLTEAMILGMMFVVAMTIFGFPNAIVIGVLVTITALVPIFGAYIAMFVGAFLILVISPIQAFWFMVMFQILQQIEGNLIYPRVVGNSIGLPGMWVLGAVLLGAGLYGIVGILLSVPLCSVAYVLLRETIGVRLKEKKLFENSEIELK